MIIGDLRELGKLKTSFQMALYAFWGFFGSLSTVLALCFWKNPNYLFILKLYSTFHKCLRGFRGVPVVK